MSVLDSYMKDLAELVNKDRGTANIAGVTEAAKIMKGHLNPSDSKPTSLT